MQLYLLDATAVEGKCVDFLTIGGEELFDRPTDVAVNQDGSRIYVVDLGGIDSAKHQVQVFNADGEHIDTIGRRGVEGGEFNLPVQLATNSQDELFVLDAGNFRVQVFSPEGEYLRSWGKVGRNGGDFARPRGLAVDADGMVYVSDTAFGNFQVFRDDGQLLLAVGKSGVDKPGSYSLPAGIAVDDFGWVYVLDQRYRKLDVIKKLEVDDE